MLTIKSQPTMPNRARQGGGRAARRPALRGRGGGGGVIQARSRLAVVQPVRDPGVVRVVIAVGPELVRAGYGVLLDADERIAVVGDAATGMETVAQVGRLRPDVVLIDAELPGLDSVEVTTRVAAEPGATVLMLTASEGDERIFAALRAGAAGALMKDTAPHELVRAVKALARGEAVLSPRLTRQLITEFAARPEPSAPRSDLLDELTGREREVVVLVALGLTNDEIAERLVISRATARTHVSRTMAKLHAHDRAKLVVFAYEAGLVVPRTDRGARRRLSLV
jgi:DNA-binding NarL/FixJ family response regulator